MEKGEVDDEEEKFSRSSWSWAVGKDLGREKQGAKLH